jgi:hypothetical protein
MSYKRFLYRKTAYFFCFILLCSVGAILTMPGPAKAG